MILYVAHVAHVAHVHVYAHTWLRMHFTSERPSPCRSPSFVRHALRMQAQLVAELREDRNNCVSFLSRARAERHDPAAASPRERDVEEELARLDAEVEEVEGLILANQVG